MSDNTPEKVDHHLAQLAGNISKPSGRDHWVNVFKAAFNALPFVGGPIASLMSDYIPTKKAQRIEEFAKDVAEAFESVEDRLDVEYIKTDEFAFLFTRAFENVSREYQTAKIEAYKNILVNALIYDIPASVQESFMNRVENLTALHIAVLSCFRSDTAIAPLLTESPIGTGSLMQTLRVLLPDIDDELIKACIHDLDVQGITKSVSDSLMTMMSAHGATQLESRLTPFGRRFVNFISQVP